MSKKSSPLHQRQVIQMLTFQLTQDEKLNRAEIAGKKRRSLIELEQEFDQVKSSYKGRLGALKLDISAALDAVKTGKERREVFCDEIKDFDAKTVSLVHEGKIHHQRTMTPNELQLSMDGVSANA